MLSWFFYLGNDEDKNRRLTLVYRSPSSIYRLSLLIQPITQIQIDLPADPLRIYEGIKIIPFGNTAILPGIENV